MLKYREEKIVLRIGNNSPRERSRDVYDQRVILNE